MAQQGIKIGGIYADLELDSGKLEQGLARGRQAMDAIDREIKRLQQDFDRGAVGIQTYTDRINELNQTMATLGTKMQAAYSAIQITNGGLDVASRGMNRLGGASSNAAMAIMQLGYMADDIQYGFKAIVNNIAPLVMGLSGGNAGVAAAAQIAAVAAYQLYERWDELMGVLGLYTPIQTAADEMKELAAQTERTADQEERLQRLRSSEKAEKQLLGEQSEAQEKSGKAIAKAISEQQRGGKRGVHNVAEGIRQSITPEQFTAEEEKELGELRKGNTWAFEDQFKTQEEIDAHIQRRIQQIENRRLAREQARARGVITRAMEDPAQLKELMKIVTRDIDTNNGDAFGGIENANTFLKQLQESSPEAIKAKAAKKEADKAAKKQQQDQQKAQQEEDRFRRQDAQVEEEAKRSDEQRSKEIAKDLAKNVDLRNKLLTNPNADVSGDVNSAMKAMGIGPNTLKRLQPQVANQLRNLTKDDINAEIAAKGGTADEAAKRIAAKEEKDRQRKAKMTREEKLREYKDTHGDIDEHAMTAVTNEQFDIESGRRMTKEQADAAKKLVQQNRNLNRQEKQKRQSAIDRQFNEQGKSALETIQAELERNGVDPKESKAMAEEFVKDARGKLDSKLANPGFLRQPTGSHEKRFSETIAGSDIGARVQAGVSNPLKQTEDLLKQSVDFQKRMVEWMQQQNTFRPRAGGLK